MGCRNSKYEKDEPLRLCMKRRRFIMQAIESRYDFSAAHVSYIHSLRSVGIALRRFAEAEVLTEVDKTPSSPSSSSSFPPSQSPHHHVPVTSDSPNPNSLPLSTMSYMKSGGSATSVTVSMSPSIPKTSTGFVGEESMDFSILQPPPPPPPFHESGSTWDYFEPSEVNDDMRTRGPHFRDEDLGVNENEKLSEELVDNVQLTLVDNGLKDLENVNIPIESVTTFIGRAGAFEQQGDSNGEKGVAEREDPSEFITHRAKDFLSSIRDIEHRFFRASESGKELSRLLEVNQIRVRNTALKGRSFAFTSLACLRLACCGEKTSIVSHVPLENGINVLTLKRSMSWQSCSLRNHNAGRWKDDDASESGSDFIEEFCMFAGSHSSSLDRLYAWERKLYDEVKAIQCIRNEYDRRCHQLHYQFAKDMNTQVIDKTRSIVKDLHSRIRVAIHTVDSISRRIERLRDEELLPQLLELVHGLMKTWKEMLECHHAQYITISLSYHAHPSTRPTDPQCQILLQNLRHEIQNFGSCFTNLTNTHISYVGALNNWFQNLILQPQGQSKRRVTLIAPPFFALCSDWFGGLNALPWNDVCEAIRSFVSELDGSVNGGLGGEEEDDGLLTVSCVRDGLMRVLDPLIKYCEAALRTFEDIGRKNEVAQKAYSNCRSSREHA